MTTPAMAACEGRSGVDPAEAILPTALALALAVAEYDSVAVTAVLKPLTHDQMHALTIVLAAHVNLDLPMTATLPQPITPEAIIDRAVNLAAAMFGTDTAAILSRSKHRHVLDARAVAMAACRLLGLSSPYVGAAFERDHSTVLYACGRVGETPRLHRLSLRVASQLGWDRNGEDVAS